MDWYFGQFYSAFDYRVLFQALSARIRRLSGKYTHARYKDKSEVSTEMLWRRLVIVDAQLRFVAEAPGAELFRFLA